MSPRRSRRLAAAASLLVSLTGGALLLWPALVRADSRFETGTASPTKASAHLDFTIIVPNVAFLRLGTGGALPGSSPTLSVTTIDATGATGTRTAPAGSLISARVVGNAGSLSLSAAAFGRGWSRFVVAADHGAAVHMLEHPSLVDDASSARVLPVTRGRITELDANWTYSLAPTAPRKTGGLRPLPADEPGPTRLIYSLSMP
ncbi:hypothetical protein [Novosphingobium huizhouense]|uniref:hypothetical protein n=1 Tax=Novosphingobium huizhouense TaxID=2866625 RepID=UPI001CD8D0BF|nr:hypothetical protein [Novosphingobium huizhouense]